ncbi:MAG: MXAN_6640 family putative metalloprotease [Balneola sp.]
MRLLKSFFSVTVLLIVVTSALEAQDRRERIPQILEQFDDGAITANEAFTRMNVVFQNGAIHKCATPIHIFAHKHHSEISPSLLSSMEKAKISSAASTYISPSGKFEFTYETTGDDAVPADDANSNGIPDYVERAAQAADFSHQKQIQELGFPDPIVVGTSYKVSFRDMGFYGFVEEDISSPAGTRMVLENDFVGFASNDDPEGNQYGALKVTVAHEFKHAIQYKQNSFEGDSDNWAEMDATLLEEVTYDEVNDYYNYLDGFANNPFNNPGSTVIEGSYEDITWALFFSEYYDELFWTDVWKRIEDSVTDLALLVAVKREVEARGDDFDSVLSNLYLWHYSSGINSIAGYGFDEAPNYPDADIEMEFQGVDAAEVTDASISRFASHYYEVEPAFEDGQVTINMEYEDPTMQLGMHVYFKNGASEQRNYTANETGSDNIFTPYFWDDIEKIGLVFTNTDFNTSNTYSFKVSSEVPDRIILSQNYPNPFNPQTIIPIKLKEENLVTLEVFDNIGRRVATIFEGQLSAGSYEFSYDASNLASGVYLYKLVAGKETKFKKMAVIK